VLGTGGGGSARLRRSQWGVLVWLEATRSGEMRTDIVIVIVCVWEWECVCWYLLF
jgi:hypothetical protein